MPAHNAADDASHETMVCKDCEKKLSSKVIVPDKWKDGAQRHRRHRRRPRDDLPQLVITSARRNPKVPGGRQDGRICKSAVSQDANYCQECAHHNGICAMCGKRVDDLRLIEGAA